MKNLKFLALFFVAVSIGFTGCENEDEDDAKARIVGKWFVTKEVGKEFENNVETDSEVEEYTTNDEFIEIKSNGIGAWGDLSNSVTIPFTYSLNSDGNRLTITETGSTDSDVFTIKTLTSNSLVLYFEDIDIDGGVTYKETVEITLKK